jgi:hypothetical protein
MKKIITLALTLLLTISGAVYGQSATYAKKNQHNIFLGSQTFRLLPGSAFSLTNSDGTVLFGVDSVGNIVGLSLEGGSTPFTGATAGAAGSAGLVPGPLAGQQGRFLRGDGSWADIGGSFVSSSIQILAGTGLEGGGDLTQNRTLSLTSTGVSAGSYTNANITVDATGRITSAASGAGGGGEGGGHTIQDEGSILTQRSILDFVGSGVTVTDDATNGKTVVTIPGGGGGGEGGAATQLATSSDPINLSPTAPASGQMLVATTPTAAEWQTVVGEDTSPVKVYGPGLSVSTADLISSDVAIYGSGTMIGKARGLAAYVPTGPFYASAGGYGAANHARMYPIFLSTPMRLRELRVAVVGVGSGTHEWGLFDASDDATVARKVAGGSGALSSTGWQSIAAAGAPVDVPPGFYLLVIKWPATNFATVAHTNSSITTSAAPMEKSRTTYTWSNTPDLVTGWTGSSAIFWFALVGDLDASGNKW